MEHSYNYERVLPLRMRGSHLRRCLLLGASYCALAFVGIFLFLATWSTTVLFLALLVTVGLILLTRDQFRAEYEYSFFGSTLTLCRILNRSRRRVLAELELKQIRFVDYDTESAHSELARRYQPSKAIDVRAEQGAPSLLLAYEKENGEIAVCRMETDETTEKILRRSIPEACSQAIKRGARSSQANETEKGE